MSKIRFRGSCAVCGKKLIVKANGTIGSHTTKFSDGSTIYCYGGEKQPIERSNEGLEKGAEEVYYAAERLNRKLSDPADHWRPETLIEMTKERDAYLELSASLKQRLRSWSPRDLEEAEPAKRQKDNGEGSCCVCNRTFKLKSDGTVRSHNFHPDTVVGHRYCEGENRRPLETTNEDCLAAIKQLQDRVNWAEKKLTRSDFDEQEQERLEIDQRVHRRYIENCQRNYDLWTSDNPVPAVPLQPITDKPELEQRVAENSHINEVQKSGCLGAILLITVLPIIGLFVLL